MDKKKTTKQAKRNALLEDQELDQVTGGAAARNPVSWYW